jgi:hypothetical protein
MFNRAPGAEARDSAPMPERKPMTMTSNREASAIAKKQWALRDQLWPKAEPNLWDRKSFKGFATIPKTMPLILKIMDELSKNAPISSTYLSLWCSTWENSFVTISKPRELAYEAGFTGQRAEYTWTTRMKRLKQLGFIDLKAGMSSDLRHVIIWNPHFVVRRHHRDKTPGLLESSYTALLEKALDIGAKDMTDAVPLPEEIGHSTSSPPQGRKRASPNRRKTR